VIGAGAEADVGHHGVEGWAGPGCAQSWGNLEPLKHPNQNIGSSTIHKKIYNDAVLSFGSNNSANCLKWHLVEQRASYIILFTRPVYILSVPIRGFGC
jgi:hypothetical protein